MPDSVTEWLAKCYAAEHLGSGPLPQAISGFRAWVAADPARRAEVSNMAGAASDAVLKRSYIDRKNKAYLQAVLAPQEN